MIEDTRAPQDHSFLIGLVTGTFVGAGLAMWFAPRLRSELRERATESARNLGRRASERYQQASSRIGETVDDIARKGQGVRNDVADTVARGAHEVARGAHEVERSAKDVERYATAAKSDGGADARRRPAS